MFYIYRGIAVFMLCLLVGAATIGPIGMTFFGFKTDGTYGIAQLWWLCLLGFVGTISAVLAFVEGKPEEDKRERRNKARLMRRNKKEEDGKKNNEADAQIHMDASHH